MYKVDSRLLMGRVCTGVQGTRVKTRRGNKSTVEYDRVVYSSLVEPQETTITSSRQGRAYPATYILSTGTRPTSTTYLPTLLAK